MRIGFSLALGALLALFSSSQVVAAGTLVDAPEAVDMVHHAATGVVYISSGNGRILRYRVSDGSFLSPIVVGGRPGGLDLSPDGRVLAVADRASSGTEVWLHLIELQTLRTRRLTASKASGEGGLWTVAFAADGSILATSSFNGSGWVPLRRFTPGGRQAVRLADVTQNTMLKASADRQTIAFAESNISDGRWGLYDVPTGQLVRRQWYQDGTSWFNYEIAVDSIGGQFAIPTYGGTFIYDVDYRRVATVGEYAGGQPVGVAYHPTRDLAYFPWARSTEVRVYDMQTFQQVHAYDAGYEFNHPGNQAFQPGRIRISGDGSLLMVLVGGGVHLIPTDDLP